MNVHQCTFWWGSKFGGSNPGKRKTPPRFGVWAAAGIGAARSRTPIAPPSAVAPSLSTSRRVTAALRVPFMARPPWGRARRTRGPRGASRPGRLLGEPDGVELLVQVVRRGDGPSLHLGAVRDDPVPLQRVEVVHLLVDQALLER